MSATPGTAEYYLAQVQASKQRQQEQAAQNQANQQVNYEAFQAANKQKQQQAITTGQPQTITQQDIQDQRQQILDTKYQGATMPTGEQTYRVPLTGVDQKAQVQAYSDYQKANIDAQRQSLISERYDAFRRGQIDQNPGEYTAYGRANVAYQVNLNDSISGGPYRYQVNLQDSISGNNARQQEARIATAGTEPNFFEGFIAGGSTYISNIPKGFMGLAQQVTGQKPDVSFGPEVEGATIGAFTTAGKNLVEGKPQTLGADLGVIGKQIGESPGYATGSLLGTAAFTAFTLGAGELPGLAVKGVRGLVNVGKAANVERDIIPAISKGIGPEGRIGLEAEQGVRGLGTESQVFKVSALRETQVGTLKQPAQEIFHSYPLEAPKSAGAPNPDLIFGKPERVTQYTQTFVKINDKEIPISAIKQGDITPTLKASDIPAGYVQPTKPAIAKGSNVFDIERGAQGENIFVKATSYEKVVATSETVTNKELAQFVQSDVNVKKLLGTYNEDLTRVSPSGNPPSTPLKFEGPPQVTAEQVRRQFKPPTDIGLSAGGAGPSTNAISAGIAKSLGSFGGIRQQALSNSRGVSLGFGGATWAERKQSKGIIEDVTTEFYRTPKGSEKSVAQKFTEQFSKPAASKAETTTLSKSLSELGKLPSLDMGRGSKSTFDITSIFSQSERTESKSGVSNLSKTLEIPAVSEITRSDLVSSTRQDFKFDVIRTPKSEVPSIKFEAFEFPFAPAPTSKKKKGKKKGLGYGENEFTRTDIIANAVSGSLAKTINHALGKVE